MNTSADTDCEANRARPHRPRPSIARDFVITDSRSTPRRGVWLRSHDRSVPWVSGPLRGWIRAHPRTRGPEHFGLGRSSPFGQVLALLITATPVPGSIGNRAR